MRAKRFSATRAMGILLFALFVLVSVTPVAGQENPPPSVDVVIQGNRPPIQHVEIGGKWFALEDLPGVAEAPDHNPETTRQKGFYHSPFVSFDPELHWVACGNTTDCGAAINALEVGDIVTYFDGKEYGRVKIIDSFMQNSLTGLAAPVLSWNDSREDKFTIAFQSCYTATESRFLFGVHVEEETNIAPQETIWWGYTHLWDQRSHANTGDRVQKGDVLGQVGPIKTSGYGNADHLHFMKTRVDPTTINRGNLRWIFESPVGVSPFATQYPMGSFPYGGRNSFDYLGKHTGIDFLASAGSEVVAVCDGTVVWWDDWPWQESGSWVNTIWLKCDGGSPSANVPPKENPKEEPTNLLDQLIGWIETNYQSISLERVNWVIVLPVAALIAFIIFRINKHQELKFLEEMWKLRTIEGWWLRQANKVGQAQADWVILWFYTAVLSFLPATRSFLVSMSPLLQIILGLMFFVLVVALWRRKSSEEDMLRHQNIPPEWLPYIRVAQLQSKKRRRKILAVLLVVLSVGTLFTGSLKAKVPSPTPTEIVKSTPTPNQPDLGGCILSSSVPSPVRKWCQIITAYSGEVDPHLIAAVIDVESDGKADAISRDGAVGLMQVMPRDGKAARFICKNGPCFANRPSTTELLNPEFNVKYGTGYLWQLYHRHGSWRLALKAYGPADVGFVYADEVLRVYSTYTGNRLP